MNWSPYSIRSATQERSLENDPWLSKRLDPEYTKIAADARALESAPGRLRIVTHAVDRDTAGGDLQGHVACAASCTLTMQAQFQDNLCPSR